jgi:hypothetical protein
VPGPGLASNRRVIFPENQIDWDLALRLFSMVHVIRTNFPLMRYSESLVTTLF